MAAGKKKKNYLSIEDEGRARPSCGVHVVPFSALAQNISPFIDMCWPSAHTASSSSSPFRAPFVPPVHHNEMNIIFYDRAIILLRLFFSKEKEPPTRYPKQTEPNGGCVHPPPNLLRRRRNRPRYSLASGEGKDTAWWFLLGQDAGHLFFFLFLPFCP